MIQDDNLQKFGVDSAAVSIFVVMLVELTNTVFVNSTNITTNIETAALSNSESSVSSQVLLISIFSPS